MKKVLFVLLALSLSFGANAQDDDIVNDFQKFREGMYKDYNEFRKKILDEYFEYVKNVWTEYSSFEAIPKPEREKLDPPVIYEPPMPEPPTPEPIDVQPSPQPRIEEPVVQQPIQTEPIIPPVIEQQPEPIIEDQRKSNPMPSFDFAPFEFKYMDTPLSVRVKRSSKVRLKNTNGGSISDFLKHYSDNSYDVTVSDCLSIRTKNHLCDWAYLNMLLSFTKDYYGSDCNESTLMAAYIYMVSGYKMRMAVADGRVYLLYASKHIIYNREYFQIDGDKYYSVGNCPSNANICNAPFPKEKSLSLYIDVEPIFTLNETSTRRLQSSSYQDMDFTVSSNKNLIDFLNSYPSSEINNDSGTRWAMYANMPLSDHVQQMLYPDLKTKIEGLGMREAVAHILNWVQTAFVYELDDNVWGSDRVFFSDETIYYPYCDCEDRSVLFSRVVRDILGLDVILVYYPGHMASAVKFSKEETYGDILVVNGQQYTICDPTYIGAPVGSAMPKYKQASANIVMLK